MRFSHKVAFWLDSDHYDPKTHEYTNPIVVATAMTNVTDLGTNRSVELLGSYDQQAKVIRLREPVEVTWSYLTIDDSEAHYVQRTVRKQLHGVSLIVGEGS